MNRLSSPYRGPWAVALLLVAGTIGWAWLHAVETQRREQAALVRHAHSLALGLSILVERLGADGGDVALELRAAAGAHLRIRPPIQFAAVWRGPELVFEAGHRAPLERPQGPGAGGELLVVRTPLPPRSQGSGARRIDHGPPWSWSVQAADVVAPWVLEVGMHDGLPPPARDALWRRIATTLGLAWLAIGAIGVAWSRSIRTRTLGARLDAERRERALLGELNLAAAGLAHETRNPLGLIFGLAQRITAADGVDPAHRQAAEQIMDEADRAAARLSDFIQFARLPRPRIAAAPMAELLGRIVSILGPDFELAGVGLTLECPPIRVECDGGMLEQVVVNLVLNSLRASPAGAAVFVRLARRGASADLSVVDAGHGVPPALRADVFKPYVTGHADGHGLGLAIVKRIADQHGWTVALSPREGGGTRATISGLRIAEEGVET